MAHISNNGDRIYIYNWIEQSNTWNQTSQILVSDASPGSGRYIYRLEVSKSNKQIGFLVWKDNQTSETYMYELNENTNSWQKRGGLIQTGYRATEMLINSDGTIFALGLREHHYRRGIIYINQWINNNWVQLGPANVTDGGGSGWGIGAGPKDGSTLAAGTFLWNPDVYSATQISMSSSGLRISSQQKKEVNSSIYYVNVYEYGIRRTTSNNTTTYTNNLFWNKLGSTLIATYGILSPDGNRIATHNIAGQHVTTPSEIKVYEWNETTNDWQQLGNTIISGRNNGNGGMMFSDDGNTLVVLGLSLIHI